MADDGLPEAPEGGRVVNNEGAKAQPAADLRTRNLRVSPAGADARWLLGSGRHALVEASVGRQIMQRLRIRKLHLFLIVAICGNSQVRDRPRPGFERRLGKSHRQSASNSVRIGLV